MPSALRPYQSIRARFWRTDFSQVVTSFQHYHLRASDVLVASYPRSGSTWLRFLLFSALANRRPDFELVDLHIPGVYRGWRSAMVLSPGGRLLQTHEPNRKEYKRVLYLVRDPRDVVCSEFRYQRGTGALRDAAPFEVFLSAFCESGVNRFGTWGSHVDSYQHPPREARIKTVRFEDLLGNTKAQLAGILDWLGQPTSEDRLDVAVEQSSLSEMKRIEKRESRGGLMRRWKDGHTFVGAGRAGGWKVRLDAGAARIIESRFATQMEALEYSCES